MRHAKIRRELYGFLRSDLSPETTQAVERHLATCPGCRRILREMEATLRKIPAHNGSASSRQEEQYWLHYRDAVEQRIAAGRVARTSGGVPSWDDIVSLVWPNRRWVFAAGSVVAVTGILLVFWHPWATEPVPPFRTADRPHPVEPDRVGHYLRRSKALLVGLENMSPDAGTITDLSSERELSRTLVREARRLREEPLDAGSARAVSDLEKILIELANLDPSADPAAVELIISGMRQRNILFKVRMAEQLRDSAVILQTRYSF